MRASVWFIVLLFATSAFAKLPPKHFPVDEKMRPRVDFWKKVYTEITSHQGFLHDPDNLAIIYRTISVNEKSRRARSRRVRRHKRELREILRSIARKEKNDLTAEEEAILERCGDVSTKDLWAMAKRVRFQRGLRDRYYEGLVRSYRYLDHIRDVLEKQDLPKEIAYLPHVESSFNYRAYSKVGAAGIWQFMRPTARMYKLRVNYVVDERRDPVLATVAATRFLRDLYRRLGTWPLALTAYNHGAASLRRAIRHLNSTDISKIISNYEGRRFGFASKNFYATFVATAEISMNPEKHFPNVQKAAPIRYSEVKLKRRYTVRQIAKATGLNNRAIKKYNPAIRRTAYRANYYLPKGYTLKVPKTKIAVIQTYERNLLAVRDAPKKLRAAGTHRVSRGENLYIISKLYRVSIADLVAINRISNPSRVYPGMRLRIPGEGDIKGGKKVIAIKKKEPKKPLLVATKAPPKSEAPPKPKEEEAKPKAVKELETILAKKEAQSASKAQTEDVSAEVYGPPAPPSTSVDPQSYDLSVVKIKKHLYRIRIEAEETLGHFAEWAGVSAQAIRRANGFRYGRPIHVGQKIKLPLHDRRLEKFNAERLEYHVALEEDFYENYRVIGTTDYVVRRGDTIDRLTKKFDVPLWLLKKYRPKEDKGDLVAGSTIKVPDVEALTVQQNARQNDEDDTESP